MVMMVVVVGGIGTNNLSLIIMEISRLPSLPLTTTTHNNNHHPKVETNACRYIVAFAPTDIECLCVVTSSLYDDHIRCSNNKKITIIKTLLSLRNGFDYYVPESEIPCGCFIGF
jgi:hypothetical protein